MRLFIFACILVLMVMLFYTSCSKGDKAKSALQPMESSVVLLLLTERAQSDVVELTGLVEQDYTEKTKLECTSFIKIGEKKTCIAQYSDEEKEINDVVISQHEHIDENGIAVILPANMPPLSEMIKGEMDQNEGIQELLEFVQ